MNGKNRLRDNGFVERLWRSVKYDEVYLYSYDSVDDAKRGLEKHLVLYNQNRPQMALDAYSFKTKSVSGQNLFLQRSFLDQYLV